MEEIKRRKETKFLKLEGIKDKIRADIDKMGYKYVDYEYLTSKIESGWCENISDIEIMHYVCETAATMTTLHPEYGKLSSRIMIDYINQITLNSFSEKVVYIQKHRNIFNDDIYDLILQNKDKINGFIDYERDYKFSYFGIISLMKSYLVYVNNDVIERPQDLFMRVSLQIHRDDFEKVKETYDLMSLHHFTHATPTLYNSLMKKPQLASCFLMSPKEDSIEGLYETLKQCALISKHSGGIGLNLHNVRSKGSQLVSTGGVSQGIIPFIQVINSTKKYINQGGNRRSSSVALYLETWHRDVFEFLDLRKNTGQEELRARDVFIGLWICDLFMKRVKNNEPWSLFCPNIAKGLDDVWGEEFEKLYVHYEETIKDKITIPAQKLWKAIIESQIETGTPYMVYKDTCNRLSNQQNLGVIKSSNLCTEIIEYSSPDEIAVCNLASVCLPSFYEDGRFNFVNFRNVIKVITRNLNKVIDVSFYPIKEAYNSNMRHRPIGIGVQGLADLFSLMKYPFDSKEARQLNKDIFENMYFAALEESCELAKEHGPYQSYEGSPISKGIFHFELCNKPPKCMKRWELLRKKILKYGVRNSLLIAPMPTASTSQLFNCNECFEPFATNIYTRRTHAGEFQIVNRYLLEDLISLGLWSYEMKNLIIEHEGSIQNIPVIPKNIKSLYKTVWEIKMKSIIDLAADRQPYIDQSQSLNLFLAKPTYSQLTSMHFYAFESGLKTGMYYLRTKPISSAIKFTVDKKLAEKTLSSMTDNDDMCEACSA